VEKVLPYQTFLREGIPTQWPNQIVSYSFSRFYVLVRTPCITRKLNDQLLSLSFFLSITLYVPTVQGVHVELGHTLYIKYVYQDPMLELYYYTLYYTQ
jgi:hypothetical protein